MLTVAYFNSENKAVWQFHCPTKREADQQYRWLCALARKVTPHAHVVVTLNMGDAYFWSVKKADNVRFRHFAKAI